MTRTTVTRSHHPMPGVRHYYDVRKYDHCPCEEQPTAEYIYRVDYVVLRSPALSASTRRYHRHVVARDAEHARTIVRALDPEFYATVKSPRRGRQVRG